MENTYMNIQTNNKQTFKNLISDKNREKFFSEFLEEDSLTKYIITGIGDNLIMSRKQILIMIQTSDVRYEIVDPYEGYCTMIINGLPITIEYF